MKRFLLLVAVTLTVGCEVFETGPVHDPRASVSGRMVELEFTLSREQRPVDTDAKPEVFSQEFSLTASPGPFSQDLEQRPDANGLVETGWKLTLNGRILDIQPDQVRLTLRFHVFNTETRQSFALDQTLSPVPGQVHVLGQSPLETKTDKGNQSLSLRVRVIPAPNDPQAAEILKFSPPPPPKKITRTSE